MNPEPEPTLIRPRSPIVVEKRGLDAAEAAEYVGGDKLMRRLVAAGWVKPFIRGRRFVRYDRYDLDRCIERSKIDDLPELVHEKEKGRA
jgi:hypothetical protein